MLDLVGNPEDRFSHFMAHIVLITIACKGPYFIFLKMHYLTISVGTVWGACGTAVIPGLSSRSLSSVLFSVYNHKKVFLSFKICQYPIVRFCGCDK